MASASSDGLGLVLVVAIAVGALQKEVIGMGQGAGVVTKSWLGRRDAGDDEFRIHAVFIDPQYTKADPRIGRRR